MISNTCKIKHLFWVQIKSLFSRLAAPERLEATEDELILAYDNAEAETIVSESKHAARKMYKKKTK